MGGRLQKVLPRILTCGSVDHSTEVRPDIQHHNRISLAVQSKRLLPHDRPVNVSFIAQLHSSFEDTCRLAVRDTVASGHCGPRWGLLPLGLLPLSLLPLSLLPLSLLPLSLLPRSWWLCRRSCCTLPLSQRSASICATMICQTAVVWLVVVAIFSFHVLPTLDRWWLGC